MAEAINTTDRRTFLTAAGATAAFAATPACAAAATPTSGAAAWDEAMRAFTNATAECGAFEPIYARVSARYDASRPSDEMIHWKEFWPANHYPGGRYDIGMNLDLDAAWQKFLDGHGKTWWAPDVEKRKAEYRAALDSIQAYRDAVTKSRRDSGMDEASAKLNELEEACSETEKAVMNTPAPHLPALRWKLDKIFDMEDDGYTPAWHPDYVRQTLADYRRLLVA